MVGFQRKIYNIAHEIIYFQFSHSLVSADLDDNSDYPYMLRLTFTDDVYKRPMVMLVAREFANPRKKGATINDDPDGWNEIGIVADNSASSLKVRIRKCNFVYRTFF